MAALFSYTVMRDGAVYRLYRKSGRFSKWRPLPEEYHVLELAWDACVLACLRSGDYRGVIAAAEQHWLSRYRGGDRVRRC